MSSEEMMTLAQTEEWATRLIVALVDAPDQVADIITGVPPSDANYVLMLNCLPRIGAVVAHALAGDDEECSAAPVFGAAASDADYFAGRLLAVAFNNDDSTLSALVEALIDRARSEDEESGARLLADTILALISFLRAVLLGLAERADARRQVKQSRRGGAS